MDRLELRIPPVPLALCAGSLMWLASRLVPGLRIELPGMPIAALALAAVGGMLSLGGILTFRSARTTVNPLHPERASTMVATGVYRLSRNPMYAGLLLALAGWAAHLSNPLALVFLPLFIACMNRFQILPEERALTAKFGEDYLAYMKAVRRWL